MAYRRRLKNKKPPEGWELIEEVIEDFEGQMKEAVNEEHEGRRKNELAWKIHRIHWEKNRFIFDLMYQRKVMSKELVRLCCLCRTASAFAVWAVMLDTACCMVSIASHSILCAVHWVLLVTASINVAVRTSVTSLHAV